MGYQAEAVTAAGLNQFPEREAEILAGAKRNIALVLERWKITAQRF
jgi:hypothetical protein